MKKIWIIFLVAFLMSFSGCGLKDEAGTSNVNGEGGTTVAEGQLRSEEVSTEPESTTDKSVASIEEDLEVTSEELSGSEEEMLKLKINGTEINVTWEENDSVNALMELAKVEPIVIDMSMYGGFEQVGSIGTSITRDDVQITSSPGDIVLYSGNQVVVFYGSNSWGYTRLGRIEGMSKQELTELLGNGDVTLSLYF